MKVKHLIDNTYIATNEAGVTKAVRIDQKTGEVRVVPGFSYGDEHRVKLIAALFHFYGK